VAYQGTITAGHNVKIGYFAQNQDELLPGDRTVLEVLDDIAVGEVRKKIRDILGSFLFSGEDVDKKVRVLSGGERNRLAMSKLLLESYNLLVLDEPTNHLDIKSKEILKNALLQYDGTVILVSHDRDFLQGLVNKVYEFTGKMAKEHLGTIQEFLEKKQFENFRELERSKPVAATSAPVSQSKKDNEKTSEARRVVEKELKRLNGNIKKVEENITRVEQEIATLNDMLARPENASNNAMFVSYQNLQQSLENEMREWENLSKQVEELQMQ
jgi:ATP-binding cassette subfamily F protein 3